MCFRHAACLLLIVWSATFGACGDHSVAPARVGDEDQTESSIAADVEQQEQPEANDLLARFAEEYVDALIENEGSSSQPAMSPTPIGAWAPALTADEKLSLRFPLQGYVRLDAQQVPGLTGVFSAIRYAAEVDISIDVPQLRQDITDSFLASGWVRGDPKTAVISDWGKSSDDLIFETNHRFKNGETRMFVWRMHFIDGGKLIVVYFDDMWS